MNQRIAKWDNIKFVLIYFVVLGHIINPYTGKNALDSMNQMYMFIWTFHMPAFIFISGLFSKKTVDNKRYDKMFSFLILYFVTKFLRSFSELFVAPGRHLEFLEEGGVPWYAFVMFIYYLITVVTRKYSKKYVMTASIVLAVFIGFDTSLGDWLMIMRIFLFYPFFYAGYICDKDKLLEFTRKKWVKAAAVVILAVFTLIILKDIDGVYKYRPILSGRNAYNTFVKGDLALKNVKFGIAKVSPLLPGMLYRVIYYVVAGVVSLSIFALVPERKCIISAIGAKTLSIYALHMCLINFLFLGLDINKYLAKIIPGHYRVLYIPLALVITLFCAIPIFEKLLNICIHPKRIEVNTAKGD